MLLISSQVTLTVSLVLSFFNQQCIAALTPPTSYPGGIVGSVSHPTVILSDPGLKSLAIQAKAAVDAIIAANRLPASLGIAIYIQATSRIIAVASIGTGTGDHGDQNVEALCVANRIPFHGGEIFTWTTRAIPPGPAVNGQYPDNRNCRARLQAAGNIREISADINVERKRSVKVRTAEQPVELMEKWAIRRDQIWTG